ncbi:carbohydrate ABC transporter permease [Pseudarthrobacter sp. LMD1-1-1.1]|uniref:carbohydrate ABC transporter permease n=1 Tax=Pseudarthrobacter sp. LMD1-1-1.1 TaxID=3135242 RepID=UPI0034277302
MAHNTIVTARPGKIRRPSVPPRPRGRRRTLSTSRSRLGAAVVTPALILLTVFFFLPVVLMLWMSLNRWPLLGKIGFIGLGNYTTAFQDQDFLRAAGFTLLYTLIMTPLLLVIGIALALLIRRPGKASRVFQSIYFLPVVVGFAAAGYLWLFMAQPNIGPMLDLLTRSGLASHSDNWFGTFATALGIVCAMVVWKVAGMQMLLLNSGLQSIPVELEEAARIDGASRTQVFRYIILPLLRPTLALVLVFSVSGSLLAFDQFYIMTSGGPANQTITAVYHIYRVSFQGFQLGYGAALSALLMIVLAIVSAIQMLILRNSDHN